MTSSTSSMPSFILGTAGHIDHGKSTLVRTLTGTDPDRLAEEKRRGITIELGFAQLQLPSGTIAGVVDVPGHERFVRHMVEGATGVDVALLVVAADDGVMVQTREHLAILELLGVRKLVTAITKADAVDPDIVELAEMDVRELLSTTAFADTEVVAVSAHANAGLGELLAAIERAGADLARNTSSDFVRLPIDRVFTIEGAGTVVTGTLWDGTIHLEDQLELLKSGSADSADVKSQTFRVRDIQVHGTKHSKARAGQRVALNLAGAKREDIKRGEMLCSPGKLVKSTRVLAQLNYTGLPSKDPDSKSSATTLKDGASVTLHHGTNETPAKVKLLFTDQRSKELATGTTAYVQLRLEKSLPLRSGDRYIIRSLSPAYTIGGGQILLTDVGQRTKLKPAWFTLLDQLQTGDTSKATLHYVNMMNTPFSSDDVALKLGLATAEVARTLNQSDLARLKTDKETIYLTQQALDDMKARTEKALLTYHTDNPQSLNTSQGALRGMVFAGALTAPSSKAWTETRFEALLISMAEQGAVILESGKISHPKAASSVQAQQEEVAAQLLEIITAQGLAVETLAQLAQRTGQSHDFTAQVLSQLRNEGKLIRLAGDFHFAPHHIRAAQEAVLFALKTQPEGMTAAELRDVMAVSRKYAIPLLEYFDAQGITRRNGELRTAP